MKNILEFIDGFRRFQSRYFGHDQSLFTQLKQGQNPRSLVIACSDSRVDPAILTDCDPGDLFVIRNVANLVPPYEQGGGYHGVSAALEFAVCTLKVEHIIIIGHWGCGGIHALVSEQQAPPLPGSAGEFISRWVNIARPARDRVIARLPNGDLDTHVHACEQEAIRVSLENLMTFPWIKTAVDAIDLTLHGWYFNINRGELLGYDTLTERFETLVARP